MTFQKITYLTILIGAKELLHIDSPGQGGFGPDHKAGVIAYFFFGKADKTINLLAKGNKVFSPGKFLRVRINAGLHDDHLDFRALFFIA